MSSSWKIQPLDWSKQHLPLIGVTTYRCWRKLTRWQHLEERL